MKEPLKFRKLNIQNSSSENGAKNEQKKCSDNLQFNDENDYLQIITKRKPKRKKNEALPCRKKIKLD